MRISAQKIANTVFIISAHCSKNKYSYTKKIKNVIYLRMTIIRFSYFDAEGLDIDKSLDHISQSKKKCGILASSLK